jgi:hypothetical protein
LTDQAGARCTEDETGEELLTTSRGAREQERGDIGAGDEKHHGHNGHDDTQRLCI